MSEVKPKFAPAVQAIWGDCGTYVDVDSINPNASANELEFFVEQLIEEIIISVSKSDGSMRVKEILIEKGYIDE